MPLGRLAIGPHLHARGITYQPFPPPPNEIWNADPIRDGPYGYSSTGFTVLNYRPKRPSEILAEIDAQYASPVFIIDRYGQWQQLQMRGGPGKRKGKSFFQAHLKWYGIEYLATDTTAELEDRLREALNRVPPPSLSPDIYDIEAEMRQRFIEQTRVEQYRVIDQLVSEGHTSDTCPLLAELTEHCAASMTDQFVDDPLNFFQTQFPPGVSRQHVAVLGNVDPREEQDVWRECVSVRRLFVERVENNRGRGINRGHPVDFVVGLDRACVRAKANELRAANNRYNPY